MLSLILLYLFIMDEKYNKHILGADLNFGNNIYKIYINFDANGKEVMEVTKIIMILISVFV